MKQTKFLAFTAATVAALSFGVPAANALVFQFQLALLHKRNGAVGYGTF
jgi:hypothetical protein